MADDTVVHRVGGADIVALRLSPADAALNPPGLSVVAGGTPAEASARMRAAFPGRKWRLLGVTVGTATVAAVRATGFDVLANPTHRLPNHARITHPAGAAGFTDVNLARLATAFVVTTGY